jgi:hypothetical protein
MDDMMKSRELLVYKTLEEKRMIIEKKSQEKQARWELLQRRSWSLSYSDAPLTIAKYFRATIYYISVWFIACNIDNMAYLKITCNINKLK